METPLLKIDSIRRCVARVRDTATRNPELVDQNAQDVVILNLQRACEQSLDLGNWLCAYRNLSIPRVSREVFTILEHAGILPPELAVNLRKMVGFRNIAVHEYQQLDPAIVRSIVTNRLDDFEELIRYVSKNLEINSGLKPEFSLTAIIDRPKLLCISIADLKLDGDDLGDDYQLEITCNDLVFTIMLQKINEILTPKHRDFATVWIEPGRPNLVLKIIAKEVDPVADDIGEQELHINLEALTAESQMFYVNIPMSGRGRGENKLRADLKLTFEVSKSNGSAQLKDVDPNGWVLAKDSTNSLVSLPAGLGVEVTSVKSGRENFVILEGIHKGAEVSISLEKNGITHLTRFTARSTACAMKLIRDRWTLQIAGLGEFEVLKMKPAEIIHPGIYQICLPDAPHQPGRRYRSKARHAESWFRIGDEGDRYIHAGSRTLGCVTVKDLAAWEAIYSHLSRCRLDNVHIGMLEVL